MTIYALSSSPGLSGVAVIRISGSEAEKIILSLTKKTMPPPRVATLRKVIQIKTKELIIPHKHLHQRMFVLRPLADIAPFFIHPESKKNIKQLIKECKDDSKVFEYEL